jgi:hypothetical protein
MEVTAGWINRLILTLFSLSLSLTIIVTIVSIIVIITSIIIIIINVVFPPLWLLLLLPLLLLLLARLVMDRQGKTMASGAKRRESLGGNSTLVHP